MKLKCLPNLDNIEQIKEILEYFLDRSFLDKQIFKIKEARRDNQLTSILPVGVHPGLDFLNFVNDLIKTNPKSIHPVLSYRTRDLMRFSLAAKTILQMCEGDLKKFNSKANYTDFRGRFRSIDGFNHLIYELYFAKFLQFNFKNVELEIFNESGVKWPDIKVTHNNTVMRIECKSLEATKDIPNKICYNIMEILHQNNKNLHVEIKLKRYPTNEAMIPSLIKSLKKLITENKFTSENGVIEITTLESKYNVNDFDQMLWPDKEDFVVFAIEGNKNKPENFIFNPKIIRLYFDESSIPKSAIDANFRNVRKKLKNIPESDIGIFALDITDHIRVGPAMKDTKFETMISKIEQIILRKFEAPENSLISGVILTYAVSHMHEGEAVVDVGGRIIQNPIGKNKFPEKFLNFNEIDEQYNDNIITPSRLLQETDEFLKTNDYDNALKKLDECIKLSSQKECYFHKGRILYNLERFSDAIFPLEKFLEIEESSDALHWLSMCYCRTGELQKGLDMFEKLVSRDDAVVSDWYNKGFTHFKLNDKSKALECVNKALELDSAYELAKKLKNYIENNP